jgi:hypothetical protein
VVESSPPRQSIKELAAKINLAALSGDPSKNPNNPLYQKQLAQQAAQQPEARATLIQPKMASANQADGSFNHENFTRSIIVQNKAQPSKKMEFFDSDEEEEQKSSTTFQPQPTYDANQY